MDTNTTVTTDKPKGVADEITDKILHMIVAGEFLPGERLPGERQLAERMGVSRVSVRAALQALKTRGYLEAVQGGGTKVLSTAAPRLEEPMTELLVRRPENLRDLQELRIILEGWAAEHAAISATEEDLAEIRKIVRQMGDSRRSKEHRGPDDRRFHMAVAKASGSIIYHHMMSQLQVVLAEALDEMRMQDRATTEYDAQILAQHRVICEAIERRDATAAGEAMRHHLTFARDYYFELTTK